MNKKIKVLMIGDHPLTPSGVGGQCGIIARALMESGKFSLVSLAGATKWDDYTPQKVQEYGDDWIIYKVNNYGTQDEIRSILRMHKPDILWFMTDPRFYYWLWDIENEVRNLVPMVYYHVWDNYPYPKFNKPLYESNDKIVSISKLTSDIVQNVAPEVEEEYLPHSVDTEIFKPFTSAERHQFKQELFKFIDSPDQIVFFWNSRNAGRKMSGTLIFWFKEWLDKVGYDKAKLLMHTEPKDPNGQDLLRIIQDLGLYKKGKTNNVILSQDKVPPNILAKIYNAADATIGISNAEGFGLSTFESLACGRPVIVNMTGGLQEQVTDGKDWFGIGIYPKSNTIIGSQIVPYVGEDKILKEDFHAALDKFISTPRKERNEWGEKGRNHIVTNYNFDKFKQRWVELMLEVHQKHGSWDTRKHQSWSLTEIKLPEE